MEDDSWAMPAGWLPSWAPARPATMPTAAELAGVLPSHEIVRQNSSREHGGEEKLTANSNMCSIGTEERRERLAARGGGFDSWRDPNTALWQLGLRNNARVGEKRCGGRSLTFIGSLALALARKSRVSRRDCSPAESCSVTSRRRKTGRCHAGPGCQREEEGKRACAAGWPGGILGRAQGEKK